MPQLYHTFAKKSTFWLILNIGLFSFVLAEFCYAQVPNDPEYQRSLWDQINTPAAWDISTGSRRVVVATLDTGADIWHGDLHDNIWENPYEIPGNGIDDDQNGYIDDVSGWNFLENNNNVLTSVLEQDDDPNAVNHGTLIAGLIGAVGNNGFNGVGVNWQVQIMPLRVVNSRGEGNLGSIVEAIDYAANNGASAISLSLVTEMDIPELKDALRRAYNKGISVIAAAGNNRLFGFGNLGESPIFPICSDMNDSENWILGVSSVNSVDQLSSFADYGTCVDLLAPGEGISSTERYAPDFGYKQSFGGNWNGTSFSAPLVAGAAALIKSIRSEWLAPDIYANLLNNADNVSASNPTPDGSIGRGRLNVGAAAIAAATDMPPLPAMNDLFFSEKSAFLRYDFAAETTDVIASMREAEIISWTAADLNGDGKKELALVIRRSPYYYVRILDASGQLWIEFPLKNQPFSASIAVSNIEATSNERGKLFLIVEKYNRTSGITDLAEYSIMGKLINDYKTKGRLAAWQVFANGNILTVKLQNAQLTLAEVNALGQEVQKWQTKGVAAFHDVKIGLERAYNSEKVVMIVGKKSGVSQIILEWDTGKMTETKLVSSPGNKWRLLVGNFNGDTLLDIWKFQNVSGSFPVYDSSGAWIRHLKTPFTGSGR